MAIETANKEKHEPFYKSLRTFFTTTHHTDIGVLYTWTALLNFLLAGIMAFIMRVELVRPVKDISPETYASLFTLHGTAMIFLFVIPAFSGLTNYLLPKMIGAKDMYWPKINALSYWLFIPGNLLIWLGAPAIGWTGYTPLSVVTEGIGVDMWILGLHIIGIASMLGALNFLVTIMKLRAPGVYYRNMPLFAWAVFATAIIVIYANPVLAAGLALLLLDRNFGTFFFIPEKGGDALLWQHVFWFFGHPEVYIIVLPAMGLVSEIIPRLARKEIYGYWAIALSSMLILFMSFGVWVHHMFTTGLSIEARVPFMAVTMSIAIPSGIKVFNWIATMYGGRIKLEVPMLFMTSFVGTFIVGGVTGVFFPVIPVDYALQDTYFVVGHFHYVIIAVVNAFFGAIYYYFPYMTGKMYNKLWGVVHFLSFTIGQVLAFTSFLVLGLMGMPRRYYDYIPEFSFWHIVATLGVIIIGIGFIIFIINMITSMRKGPKAPEDPWGAKKYGMPDLYDSDYYEVQPSTIKEPLDENILTIKEKEPT
ncbi:MAG: cbb3-type cytochrome c oxidase subunit I [Nitrososphaerales archaeon]